MCVAYQSYMRASENERSMTICLEGMVVDYIRASNGVRNDRCYVRGVEGHQASPREQVRKWAEIAFGGGLEV